MSKFKRFIAVPCVIIFISIYLIGANLIKKIDYVDNLNEVASYTSQNKVVSEKININNADVNELMLIDGIGEDTANKIIKKREELGGFRTIEQIKEVYGIGDKKFESIKDLITVE